MMTLLEEAHHY